MSCKISTLKLSISQNITLIQQQLASLCDFEKSNMSRLEADNANPTIYTLYKISLTLEIELVDLLQLK